MKIKKIISILMMSILLLNVALPQNVSAESISRYAVMIGDKNNQYALYHDLIVFSPKKNLMVKAHEISKYLGLAYTYDNNEKKMTIKNNENGKSLVFIRDSKSYLYYSSDKAEGINKTAEYQFYYDIDNKCNVINISTLQDLLFFKYHKLTKNDDYYAQGYNGIIVYSKYKSKNDIPTVKKQSEKTVSLKFTEYKFDLPSIKTSGDKKISNTLIYDFMYEKGVYLLCIRIFYNEDKEDEGYYEAIYYSKDRSSWKQVLAGKSIDDLSFANNKFYVNANIPSEDKYPVLESEDGISWNECPLIYEPSVDTDDGLLIGPIVYGAGSYITYSQSSFIWGYYENSPIPLIPTTFKSHDGYTWEDNYQKQMNDYLEKNENVEYDIDKILGMFGYGEDFQFEDMVFHEGLFIGITPKYYGISGDGLNWTYYNTLAKSNDYFDNYLWSIKSGNGNCIIAQGTNIWYSADGNFWNIVYSDNNASFTSAAYGNGVFVVTNNEQKYILWSEDGLHWSKINIPGNYVRLFEVYYCNGRFYLDAGYGNGVWFVSNRINEPSRCMERPMNTLTKEIKIRLQSYPYNEQKPQIDFKNMKSEPKLSKYIVDSLFDHIIHFDENEKFYTSKELTYKTGKGNYVIRGVLQTKQKNGRVSEQDIEIEYRYGTNSKSNKSQFYFVELRYLGEKVIKES